MNRAEKNQILESRTGLWRKKAKFYRAWIEPHRIAKHLERQTKNPQWGQW